jgi:hypothetical protein
MRREEGGKLGGKGRDGGPDIDIRRLLGYQRMRIVAGLGSIVANMWSLSYVIDEDSLVLILLFLPLCVDNTPFRSGCKRGLIIEGIEHVAIFS